MMRAENISEYINNSSKARQRFQEKLSLFNSFDEDFNKIESLQLNAAGDKEVIAKIGKLRLMLKQTTKSVSFLGVIKAGKSSLINAIVGKKVLPSRTNRATGVITKISYGTQKQAQVIYSSSKKASAYFPIEELDKYILLDVPQATTKAPEVIKVVNIEIPLPLLDRNYYLVDTPGLLDHVTLTKSGYEQIENSDLCVVVLAADKLLSEQELIAIAQVNHILNGNVVFLLNRMGQIDEEEKEEIIAWVKSSVLRMGNYVLGYGQIFPTDAMQALSYKTNGGQYNQDDVKGLLNFENWLNYIFSRPLGDKLAMLSRLGIVDNCLSQALGHFQIQSATAKKNIEHLEERAREDLQKRQQLFKADIDEVIGKIQRVKGEVRKNGEDCLLTLRGEGKKLIDSNISNLTDHLQRKWMSLIKNSLLGIEVKLQEALKKTNIKLEILANSLEVEEVLYLNLTTVNNDLIVKRLKQSGTASLKADLARIILAELDEVASGSLNCIYAYLEKFFYYLVLNLKKYISENQPVLNITPTLAQTRTTLVEYKQAQELIKRFKVKVESLKNQL